MVFPMPEETAILTVNGSDYRDCRHRGCIADVRFWGKADVVWSPGQCRLMTRNGHRSRADCERTSQIARPLTLHPVIRCPAIPLSCFPALGTSALPDGNSRNQVFNFKHLGPERFSGVGVISLRRANCVRTCNARQADRAPF
jgi:hypothetical protein